VTFEPKEREMKRIAAVVVDSVVRIVRPRPSLYPAPVNVMHTRPIFERPSG
jgi:hypothetical protein